MASDVAFYLNKESYPLSRRIGAATEPRRQLNEDLRGRDVNWRSGINTIDHETGLSPLMVAAIQGKREIALALIDRGADVDLVDEKKARTALHFAAKCGHAEIVQDLLRRGAHANALDTTKKTALMLAAKSGFVDCMTHLLRGGARVNLVDMAGYSAMHFAARFGHPLAVKTLIQATAAVELRDNQEGLTPLHLAAQFGRRECAFSLLTEGAAKVDKRSAKERLTPLMLAAKEGNKSLVSLLLTHKADANAVQSNGWTALHFASSWGRRDCAHLLLVDGLAHVNARDRGKETDGGLGAPPIIVAAKSANIACIRVLMHYGAEVDLAEIVTGENALSAAATLGLTDVIHCLLSFNADINRQNPLDGATALMRAAGAGQRGALLSLLDTFADANILDYRGKAALDYAERAGHTERVFTAITQCSQFAKVNLLPWIERECARFAYTHADLFAQAHRGQFHRETKREASFPLRGGEKERERRNSSLSHTPSSHTLSDDSESLTPFARKPHTQSYREYDSDFDSTASHNGLSSFLHTLLYGEKGLFFGLFSLPPDCDVFLFYSLSMIAAACASALHTHTVPFTSTYHSMRTLRDRDAIREIQRQCERMLVACVACERLRDERILADMLILGSHSATELWRFSDDFFLPAFFTGPLALCIENKLSKVLDCERVREMTHRAFVNSQREEGWVVDGYGLHSNFLRWRYCPAFLFLAESLSHTIYLFLLAIHTFTKTHTSTTTSTLSSFSSVEIGLALFAVSFPLYQIGLLEEIRWRPSPSIVFDLQDLERRRFAEMWAFFVPFAERYCEPFRALSLAETALALAWLALRITSSSHNTNSVTAELCLSVSAIPAALQLLRPLLFFSRSLALVFFSLLLALYQLQAFLYLFVLLCVGFGLAFFAIFRQNIGEFSSVSDTAETLFIGVLRDFDFSLFANNAASTANPLPWQSLVMGRTLSLIFVFLSILLFHSAISGRFACEFTAQRERASEWLAQWRCERVREFSVSLEKSPLSILPPPLSLCTAVLYVAHTYTFFAARVSSRQRTAISVAGAGADALLAIFLLPFCAVYEYIVSVSLREKAGLCARLTQLALTPVGATYAALCLLWKASQERALRCVAKSRLSDGRLRVCFSHERDVWESQALARFEDKRVFELLRREGGRGGGAEEVAEEVARIEREWERERRRLTHRSRTRTHKDESLMRKYGNADKDEDEDGEIDSESDNETDSDVELDAYTGRAHMRLWQKIRKTIMFPSHSRGKPRTHRENDTLGRTKGVRVFPQQAQRFLELAQVNELEEVTPGLEGMRSEKERERVRRIRESESNDENVPHTSHIIHHTPHETSAKKESEPKRMKDIILRPSTRNTTRTFKVLTAKDVHSDAPESCVAREEELREERARDPPLLLWLQNDALAQSLPERDLNPFQAGIERASQWQELSQEVEPSHAHVVSHVHNPFDDNESDDEREKNILANSASQKAQSQRRVHKEEGDTQAIKDPAEQQKRAWRKEWSARVARESDKRGEKDVDHDGNQIETREHLQNASLYFAKHRFAAIFTAQERQRIFAEVLPEIFFADDTARALENENGRLHSLEERLRVMETAQLKQLEMMQMLLEKLSSVGADVDVAMTNNKT